MEQIKVSVDINVNLSDATKQFFTNLFGGHATQAVSTSAQPASVAQPAPKPAPAAKPAPAPSPAPAKPAPAPVKPAKPAAPAESTVDIEQVRAALGEKVNQHRAEIKEKLTELGAKSVTTLDPAKYDEMYNFLKSLD